MWREDQQGRTVQDLLPVQQERGPVERENLQIGGRANVSQHIKMSDKITCTVGFVNCFLRVPLACLGCRVQGSKVGTPKEISENILENLLYN